LFLNQEPSPRTFSPQIPFPKSPEIPVVPHFFICLLNESFSYPLQRQTVVASIEISVTETVPPVSSYIFSARLLIFSPFSSFVASEFVPPVSFFSTRSFLRSTPFFDKQKTTSKRTDKTLFPHTLRPAVFPIQNWVSLKILENTTQLFLS